MNPDFKHKAYINLRIDIKTHKVLSVRIMSESGHSATTNCHKERWVTSQVFEGPSFHVASQLAWTSIMGSSHESMYNGWMKNLLE